MVRALAGALVLFAAALAGCQRGADTGASSLSNAPGSSTGAGGVPGPSAQPGTGLQGGLGASNGTSALGAGPNPQDAAAAGSSNRTPSGSFGNRR